LDSRIQLSAIVPIGLVVVVAVVCILGAVLSSAHRADEVALRHERQLFANAIADRKAQVAREAESIIAANPAAYRQWSKPDPTKGQAQPGLELKASFQADGLLVVDPADHLVYAVAERARVEPNWFADGLGELATMIDSIRGRRIASVPGEYALASVDPPGNPRPSAGLVRVQNFLNRPAIVAALTMTSADDRAGVAAGPPPVLIAVSYLDRGFVRAIGLRLDLTELRLLGFEPPAPGESVFPLIGDDGRLIDRFAWTPSRPGAQIVRTVVPFLGIAFGCFALLAAFVMRYMRTTAATIAAGEDRLRHLAMHDPLSGLPNRAYFAERLAGIIEEVGRSNGRAAVLSIDLDRFKDVNDTLGHLVGDALIRSVADRLVPVVREGDLVARLGGDEFAVITSNVADLAGLQAITDRLIESVRAPYQVMGHTIVIGASIGIALIDRQSGDSADIMRCSDVALYRAKNDGRNRACIYDADMDADLRERKELEQDLRDAIEHDRLSLAYQPIVNPAGELMVGAEALCRWRHAARGDIAPSVFIPIAERSDLIVALGEWVLRQACREATAWPGLVLAVNVSPLQFRRPDFVRVVERILAETGLEPTRLELEVTETTLIGNVEDAEVAMRRLKKLGVRLSLDDFGTGYSSLLYLRSFPFDKLKIDRSFVRNIESAPEAAAIVHAIVGLGRGLGMKVTAEGVETAEQHLFLRVAGVHSIQGFRFGRPAPAHAIAARLADQALARPTESRPIAARAG
jgi:diguanylate cyclase (GGDEF)-like protein